MLGWKGASSVLGIWVGGGLHSGVVACHAVGAGPVHQLSV